VFFFAVSSIFNIDRTGGGKKKEGGGERVENKRTMGRKNSK
jgi:hypothetical protein